MSKEEKFELANDIDFLIAIETAQNNKPALQTKPFQTIEDRIRLISELEKCGFKIVKK